MNQSEAGIVKLEALVGLAFTESEKQLLIRNIREVYFHKGAIPVEEGQNMQDFFFLVSGLVKGYYLDEDGKELVKCFSREGQFFSSECFRTGEPSSFYVECVEECCCMKVPYQAIREIPGLADKISSLYVQEVNRLEKRVRSMLQMDAKERYLAFLQEYSGLSERIALRDIASYIGIEPASLSRIRHENRN